MNYTNKLLVSTIGAALLSCTTGVHAANWLALQGTEPEGQSARAKVWGFVQPEYQSTSGSELAAGPWSGQAAIFNQIGPNLQSDSQFSIRRARIGIRGTGFPLDTKVNYFLLAEFGNNGITRPGGGTGSAKLTDASITLNHIKGARVRVGQFKTPGAEEGLQAIHVFDYINFTGVTNGLLLERYFNGDGSDTFVTPGGNSGAGGDANRPNGPVGAFRDIGIQVFDTFKVGNWEHSYAVMLGNGNGITRGDNDGNKETYLYWSSELIYAGKGGRRQGLKLFVWNQDGKRTLTTAGAGEYDRTRSGLGTTFRKDKIRAAFEYITADGMIFNGTDGAAVAGSAANGPGTTASFNVETDGEADGWYLHFGYAVLPKLELDIRYDTYNRVTNVSARERTFTTTTLGAQYFLNKKSRITLNYEIRDAEAPNLPSAANPNRILDGLDDRVSLQLISIF
ncbi:MAG: porin [Thiotrichaceae bacterium]|nr:MAG: porin [Thiotrichaceae bacterium]